MSGKAVHAAAARARRARWRSAGAVFDLPGHGR